MAVYMYIGQAIIGNFLILPFLWDYQFVQLLFYVAESVIEIFVSALPCLIIVPNFLACMCIGVNVTSQL
jgi:hypothetical protein